MKQMILFLVLFMGFFQQTAKASLEANKDVSTQLAATKKIYYLLASPKGLGRSLAGHAFLRLGNQDEPSADDMVIEFVADTPADDINYWKAFGITSAYDRGVVVEKYKQVQYSMNFLSDRTLTSYELKLTSEQKTIFLKKLATFVSQGKMGSYSFLGNNCADAVSELFSVIGISLSWPVNMLPTSIPASLAKKNLVLRTFEDAGLSRRRELLVAQYSLLKNLSTFLRLEDLSSSDGYKRVAALLSVKKFSANLSAQQKFEIKTFLLAASFLENRFLRDDLINHINDKSVFDMGRLLSQEFDLRHQLNRAFGREANKTDVELIQSGLQFSQGQFYIQHRLRGIGGGAQAGVQKTWTLKQNTEGSALKRGPQNQILLGNRLIGYVVSSDVSANQVLLTQGWVQSSLTLNQGKATLTSIFFSQPMRGQVNFQPGFENESSVKNNHPADPMCFGLVDFQKKLLENVVWRPDLASLSAEQNLKILQRLMAGDIVVIPGFANARAWTESLPQNLFVAFMGNYHRTKYTQVTSALETYFKQIEMNETNLKFVLQKAKSGISTPLFFRTSSGYGHAILVTGGNIQNGKVQLQAYDPNVLSKQEGVSGFTKDIFELDLKTGVIKSFLYGVSQAYFISDTLSSEFQTREVMANSQSVKLLKSYSDKLGKFTFKLIDFQNAY